MLRHYKNSKVKYIKALEITQLIKKELSTLEMRAPQNCLELIDNIKRFLKIIDNNEKNSNQQSKVSQQWQHEEELLR